MRKLILSFVVLLFISVNADAQRGVKKGKGGCFCDAAAKKGAGFYAGVNGFAGFFSYHEEKDLINPVSFGPGIQIGANINKNFSIESGFSYYQLKDLRPSNADPNRRSISYFDIPIVLIYRIPNDNNGIIPYLGIGGVNNIVYKTKVFANNDLIQEQKINNFEDFFVLGKAGMNFIVANKISLFSGLNIMINMRQPKNGLSKNIVNYNQRFSIEAGINYHF